MPLALLMAIFSLKHIIIVGRIPLLKIIKGGNVMWSIFVYFLVFLVPGLFAVLVYNLICCHRMDCCKTIASALIYDLLILGINLAGLRFIKCIDTFQELQVYFNCLSFTPKYILLSLVIGIVLAIFTCLLSHLLCWCRRHFHHDNKCCTKK